MKLNKYILMSTAILGLVNPLMELNNIKADSFKSSVTSDMKKKNEAINSSTLSETNKNDDNLSIGKSSSLAPNIASGTRGTAAWVIDADGTLIIEAGSFDGNDANDWANYGKEIKKIIFNGDVKIAGTAGTMLFAAMPQLTEIVNLNKLDTSNVTDMVLMFGYDTSLKSIDVSEFNTSNVTNMSSMFALDTSVSKLDLSSFDTSKVTNMSGMFSMDRGNDGGVLTKIDLSSFDTSKVTNMSAMFFNVEKLNMLSLGAKTVINSDASLISPNMSSLFDSNKYTGKWQNIGSGTETEPKGDWEGNSDELYINSRKGVAETYVWQPKLIKAENVTAKYVDTDNNKIAADEVKSGNIGDSYRTEQKNIQGYTFKEVQGNTTGILSDKPQTVTYIYTKNAVKAADVTVKYIDENGKDIEDPTIISGNVDDPFETKQKDFDGYTFHDVKGETSGKLESQSKTVTYTYYKNDGSNHTVNFYDGVGKKIADEISINGTYKDSYDLTNQVNKILEELNNQGYKLVTNYGSIKGDFVQIHDGAGYVFTKLPASEVGTAKINYIDENGNKIADSEIMAGMVGTDYKTYKKDINGYTFKEVQGNETGKFNGEEQIVTYVYIATPDTNTPTLPANPGTKTPTFPANPGTNTPTLPLNPGTKTPTFPANPGTNTPTFPANPGTNTPTFPANPGTNTPTLPVIDDNDNNVGENDSDSSGNNNSNQEINENNRLNDKIINDSKNNNVVDNLVEEVQTVLPKTAAKKVILAGIVSAVLASLAGLVIWNKRK